MPEGDTEFPSPLLPRHQFPIPGSMSGDPGLVDYYPQASVLASSQRPGPELGLGSGNLNRVYDPTAVPYSAYASPFPSHGYVYGNPDILPSVSWGNHGSVSLQLQFSAVPSNGNMNYNTEPVADFGGRQSTSSLGSVQPSSTFVTSHEQNRWLQYGSGRLPQVSDDRIPISPSNESARSSPARPIRRYVEQACGRCRAKKRKCTGQKTGCDTCRKHGVLCEYPESNRRSSR